MTFVEAVTLVGTRVVLAPLSAAHVEDLKEAARDGELWRLWYTSVPTPERMTAEIERRLELQRTGSMLPFAVIDPTDDKAVGMTAYMNVDAVHRRLEIGSTWYAKHVQRTGLNTEAKVLLLTHAFEALGCIAVEFRTHWMNQQSRAAIARLGARQDGVLRNHQIASDGTLRDTVVFSIIASEWPAVKSHLQYKLAST
ncbi:MAG: GNAT family protein [Burkholderiaceae bacterium]